MGSPNPLPEDLVVNLGSNILSFISSGTPSPSSLMVIEDISFLLNRVSVVDIKSNAKFFILKISFLK